MVTKRQWTVAGAAGLFILGLTIVFVLAHRHRGCPPSSGHGVGVNLLRSKRANRMAGHFTVPTVIAVSFLPGVTPGGLGSSRGQRQEGS